ncbi:MAG TPA: tetratricopeptide repeat protein [Gemmataceae bacterium]|nr:tetratricopeptide repeat protein [Gemmataceae bacterium]
MSAVTIEGLFQKARQAIEQRDWTTAKMMYLQALGLKSDLPDVHYGLATVYFQLRELTSAAHHFKEVTRLDSHRVGAYVNLGAVLNLLDQVDEAIVALRRSIQLDAKRVEGYYNLGLVYRRKGQTDLAIQAYREAIRLNPRMSDAHLNLANLLFEKEQYRLAETHYQKALELRPGWEKAIDGLEAAREAAALEENKAAGGVAVGAGGRLVVGGGSALDQTIDPTVHATLLTGLHQATIDAMDAGRLLQQILEKEVEPAIKDLSTSLLNAGAGGGGDLDDCVKKFEAALQHMRDTQSAVGRRIAKLRDLEGHFPADE